MIVLVDDIKLNDETEFLEYINTIFSDAEIKSLDELYEYLLTTENEVELLISDFDQVKNTSLAERVILIFTDASESRSNIKLTRM